MKVLIRATVNGKMQCWWSAKRPEEPSCTDAFSGEKAIEEQKHLERLKKINAIEGLQELEDASIAWKKYYSDYRHFIEDGAEGKAPKKPEASLEELVRKYPRANAYMKAEGYAYSSSNDVRASAGKKALERILNGEDYEQAIADMKKEWHDYCEEHVFDN